MTHANTVTPTSAEAFIIFLLRSVHSQLHSDAAFDAPPPCGTDLRSWSEGGSGGGKDLNAHRSQQAAMKLGLCGPALRSRPTSPAAAALPSPQHRHRVSAYAD